jgi:hypothetical protein
MKYDRFQDYANEIPLSEDFAKFSAAETWVIPAASTVSRRAFSSRQNTGTQKLVISGLIEIDET